MTIQAFPGFKHFTTHHCVTGSLRHIYEFYDYPISEEMLLGLGAGVGFIYWHMKGTLPFIGGRANAGRPGEEGLEAAVGRCTGVEIQAHRTESTAKAEKSLVELLQWRAGSMAETCVGARDDLLERRIGEDIANEGAHHLVSDGLVGQTFQRRDLAEAQLRDFLGYIEAAVTGEAAQHGLFEIEHRGGPAC